MHFKFQSMGPVDEMKNLRRIRLQNDEKNMLHM